MALINRINRLFRADLHAVLDRIEEPEALLRESVREMAAAIATDQRCLQQLTQREAELNHLQQQRKESLAKLTSELDVCFAADQEALARGLIKRRLQGEQGLAELEQRQQQVSAQTTQLRQRLQQNSSRLEAIEQKLVLVVRSEAANQSGENSNLSFQCPGRFDSESAVDDTAVEVAFLAEKQRRAS